VTREPAAAEDARDHSQRKAAEGDASAGQTLGTAASAAMSGMGEGLTAGHDASEYAGAEPEQTEGDGSPAQFDMEADAATREFDMEADAASGHFDMTADARELSAPPEGDERSAQPSVPGHDAAADLPLPDEAAGSLVSPAADASLPLPDGGDVSGQMWVAGDDASASLPLPDGGDVSGQMWVAGDDASAPTDDSAAPIVDDVPPPNVADPGGPM
jgi:hypothetical protein